MGVTHKDRGEHVVGDLTVLDDLVIHDDVTITGDIVIAGDFTLGESGTGSDFTVYGDTALYKVWFDASGDTNGAVYFGADTYGIFTQWFGDTTGYYVKWDPTGDTNGAWYFGANTKGVMVNLYAITTGGGVFWDPAGDSNAGELALGATGGAKGVDLKAYGNTTGNYLLWDQGVNDLLLVGTSTNLVVSGTDNSTSLATGSIRTSGGLAVTLDMWLGGGELDVTTVATDIVIKANTAAALEIYDAATKLLAFDTQNTISGVEVIALNPGAGTIPDGGTSTRNGVVIKSATTTMAGTTQITTTFDGLSFKVEVPTITRTGAATVDQASTVYIAGVPVGGGDVTITTPYALEVEAGTSLFGGDVNLEGHDIDNVAHLGLASGVADDNRGITYTETLGALTDNVNRFGIFMSIEAYKTSAVYTGVIHGGRFSGTVDSANTQNWTNATVGLLGAHGQILTETGTAAEKTVTGAASFYADATINAAANDTKVTNYYGLYIAAQTLVGNTKLTNDYGIYIASQAGGATKNVGVSINGCAVGAEIAGTTTTGLSISATSLDDAIKISGTTPVDGIEISSVCSGNAINISGTQTTTFFDATLSTTGVSKVDGIDFNWTSATTYGASGDRIRGATGNMEAFLTIGDDQAASTISGAGSHLAIYTNLNVTATLSGDTDVVGGGYHVITLSQIPTTNMGIIVPVTGYIRNAVVCDGSTEFIGSRAVIYTASNAESVSQIGFEVAIIDQTAARATAADIKGLQVTLNIADVVDSNCHVVGIQLEEEGAAAASEGIYFSTGTWTTGIDFNDQCTTAIDIGNATTGINLTGTIATGIQIATGTTLAMSIAASGAAAATRAPVIDINWTTASTCGGGDDPIYGSMAEIEGAIQVGDAGTAATVTAAGSHVAFLSNLTLSADLAQYDLFGGVLSVCTVDSAQTTTDSVTSAVTGYIRNTGTAVLRTGIQEAVRGVIWTGSDGINESQRQVALYGALIDKGAHNSAKELRGLQLDIKSTDLSGGTLYAIEIISDPSAYMPAIGDPTAVIHLNHNNYGTFVKFDSDDSDFTSDCKPIEIAALTGIPDTTGRGALKITIGANDYYIPFHLKTDITGLS